MPKDKSLKAKPKAKAAEAKTKKNEYKAEDIQVLEGREAVRRRPGMYIGSTDQRGLHHLVYEITYNSIDEAMAGFCSNIWVTFCQDNTIKVEDNGRGIPVDIHPSTKKTALETVMTVLHAGAKFGGHTYVVSGGLHGVGASVVNALSSWLTASVHRDGKVHQQEYKKGIPTGKVEVVGRTGGQTVLKYHQAAEPSDEGRLMIVPSNPAALWLDDYPIERVEREHVA